MNFDQLGLFAPGEPSIEGIDPLKICAAYCCELISSGKVRKPVLCNGDLWINTGGQYSGGYYRACVYRLAPVETFDGPTYTYGEKMAVPSEARFAYGDFARRDPLGFYHGMVIQHGGRSYAICGPSHTVTVDSTILDRAREVEMDEPEAEDGVDYHCDLLDELDEDDAGDELEDVEQNLRDAEAGGARDPRNHRRD